MSKNKRVTNERDGCGDDKLHGNEYFNGKKDINKFGAGDSFYYSKFVNDRDQSHFKSILEEVDF